MAAKKGTKASKTKDLGEFTKYEQARILGSRALQIAMGAPFLVKLSKKELESMHYSSLEIAKKELEAGLIPITIKRPLPMKHGEEGQA